MADMKSLKMGNMGQPDTGGMADTSRMTDDDEHMNNNNLNEQDTDVFTCLVCSMCFYNKLGLMRHLSKIHRLTNLCRICYFDLQKIERFANPVSLRNHNLRCHSDKMVKCVCGSMLINSKMLTSHLKKFKCDVSTSGASKNRMVRCVCGKRFSSQEQIALHQSKCRKRWIYSDNFNDSNTTSTPVAECPVRRTRAQTKVEACSRQGLGSLKERSQNVDIDTDHDNYHPRHTVTRSGRKSKHRTYMENITYAENEDKMDETFRQAVVSSLYQTSLYSTNDNLDNNNINSLPGNEHTDKSQTSTGRPTVTSDKMEYSPPLDNDNRELDLKTTCVRNRNSDDRSRLDMSEKCRKNRESDMNNNVPCVSPGSIESGDLTTSEDIASGNVANGNHTEYKVTKQNRANYAAPKDDNNNDVSQMNETCSKSVALETNKNLLPGITTVSKKIYELNSNMKFSKMKDILKRKRGTNVRAICFWKRMFACNFCGHLYKKPYLYNHQRMVHHRTTRSIVAMTTTLTTQAGRNTYRCYWCRYVSVHWTNAVKHHYKQHQGKELNILCLSST